MVAKKSSEKYKDKILNLYNEEKLTTYEIAKKIRKSYGFVYNVLSENNVVMKKGRRRKKTLLDDHKDEIIEDYISGKSAGDICYKYDVYPGAIISFLKRNGVKIRNKKDYSKKYDEKSIIDKYQNGMIVAEIAREMKIIPQVIYSVLHKNNIEIKGSSVMKKLSGNKSNIISSYENGISANTLSRFYRVSVGSIIRFLKNNGLDIRSK